MSKLVGGFPVRPSVACAAWLVLLVSGGSAAAQAPLTADLAFEAWAENVRPDFARVRVLARFAEHVEHDVLGLRLEYRTEHRGKELTVSGLVVFPLDLEGPAPILVWNHGTIFSEHEAPSSWTSPVQLQVLPALKGMIVFLPDYVGYGVSADKVHPYVMREEVVGAVIDMVHAGRAFLDEEGVAYSDELYLFGFSEGGYVTLATAHELDNDPSHDLPVTEVHAVSGPYDLVHTSRLVLADEDYPVPAYVAFFYGAYNERYWKRPTTDFFIEPFAEAVAGYQSRESTLSALAGAMPQTVGELLEPGFRERLENGGEVEVKAALARNSVPPWKPRAKTYLYHGTADRDVPFELGETQHEAMLAAGADASQVQFIAFDGADHGATIVQALQRFLRAH